MSLIRIALGCFLIATKVSFGQISNYGVTINGKYYSSEQLDSMLFADEIEDIVKNISSSRQSVNLETTGNTTKKEAKTYKDPTLQRAANTIFNMSGAEASKFAPGTPAPLIEIKAPEYFGVTETDYYRFAESTCYIELGFSPHKIGTSEYQLQLKRYQECENDQTTKKFILIALIVFGVIVIFLVFKAIKKAQVDKKKHRLYKPIEINEALRKLDELNKALDSGLLDESTFQEMKAKIQERIKKDL